MTDSEVKTMWKSQASHGGFVPDLVHVEARRFQRRIGRRNLGEYLAAIVVLAWSAHTMWNAATPMFAVAAALTIAATLFVVWQIHRRGSMRAPPESLGLPSMAFHRAELVRQRDALRAAWAWYVLPFVPGGVAMRIAVESLPTEAGRWASHLFVDALLIAFAVGVAWLNRYGARQLEREIEALDALGGS